MPRAFLVVDLGFGDSGKGTLVDALADRVGASLVVRFNGGAQAGHNVVTPDGRHHTFAQFGAASFQPGVLTYLSRFVAWNPLAMMVEARRLASVGVPDALYRLLVDRRAPVTTPYHQATNRLRELLRGEGRHGSCGAGYGETVRDQLERPECALSAGDVESPARLRAKLRALREAHSEALGPDRTRLDELADAARELAIFDDSEMLERIATHFESARARVRLVDEPAARSLFRERTVVFEGAQGVLLDQDLGFHPHTTWSTTTFAQAETVLAEVGFTEQPTRIGVTRTYVSRHGEGPLPTWDPSLDLPEPHNPDHAWQGSFRRGPLDLVLLRYALAACGGVDCLGVTHLDRLPRLPPVVATAYESPAGRLEHLELPHGMAEQAALTALVQGIQPFWTDFPVGATDAFLEALSSALAVPVAVSSAGPTRGAKVWAGRALTLG